MRSACRPKHQSQFSHFSPGTLSNSLTLLVTKAADKLLACAAIRRSMLPMGGAYSLQLETDVSIMYRGSTVEGRDLERT